MRPAARPQPAFKGNPAATYFLLAAAAAGAAGTQLMLPMMLGPYWTKQRRGSCLLAALRRTTSSPFCRGPAMLSICCFTAMFLFLAQCAGEGVPAAATPNRTILAAV